MLIAIRCDAGKDTDGTERKVTVYIDHFGHRQMTKVGWPAPDEEGIHWGPVLGITPKEYLLECQIACAEA
jgi:hypothetical protein